MREDHLRAFPHPDARPVLENLWHAARVETLRAAATVYAADTDQFLMVEKCV